LLASPLKGWDLPKQPEVYLRSLPALLEMLQQVISKWLGAEYPGDAALERGFPKILLLFRNHPYNQDTTALLIVLIDIIHEVSSKEGKT
jgi:hypothetical protein